MAGEKVVKIPGTRPVAKERARAPKRLASHIAAVRKRKIDLEKQNEENQKTGHEDSEEPLWPTKAIEPKVWVPYDNPPGGVPRRIVIERKRRDFDEKNITDLLAEQGIDYKKASSKYEVYLPLEAFDDTEYDCRTPEEWLSLGQDGDKMLSVPAIGLFIENSTGEGNWKDCRVVDFNSESNTWKVEADFTTEEIWLPRINLMFKAEDPEIFCERVVNAHRARKEVESILRYNLYIDSMPTDEVNPLTNVQKGRIASLALNTPKLQENEAMLSTQALLDEINQGNARTMNKIVFDTSMKNPKQRELFSFLSLPPEEEEEEAPFSGVVDIPEHNFEQDYSQFRFQTYYSEPAVLQALLLVREEMLEKETFRLFQIPLKKTVSLTEFDQHQKNELEKISKLLKESWVTNVKNNIKSSLKRVGKGWLNIFECEREIYEMSKMKGFMTAIRYMMEDSLRFMTEDSLTQYVEFIQKMFEYEIEVRSIDNVENEDLTPREDWEPKKQLLFNVEIVFKDGNFALNTPNEEFKEVLLNLFDNAVNEMRTIPQVEKFVLDQFFWSSEPSLSAIRLTDQHVKEWRQQIEDVVTKAVLPVVEYVKLYDEYLPLCTLNMLEYAKEFAAEEHTLQEVRQEILTHRKYKKEILRKVPQKVQVGGFNIDCQSVRNMLSKRSQQQADLILEYLNKRAKGQATTVVNGYVKLSRELNKAPQNIEQLTKIQEFQSTLPLKTEELNEIIGDMKGHYDMLEVFKYPLSDEEFKQKCAAISWPKKLLEQNERVDAHLVKERENFRERMIHEQTQFQKDLDATTRVVSQFAKHSDLDRVASIAHEVKLLQKQIKEYQERAKDFNSKEILFEMDVSPYKQLDAIVKNFEPFAHLWLTANLWISSQESWHNDPFETLDAVQMENEAKQAKSTIAKCVKQFKEMPKILDIAKDIQKRILSFEPKLPLIVAMRNPGIRQRHWEAMSEAVGVELVPGETIRTLQDVFDKNLLDHLEAIQQNADVAAQEYTIEKALTDMREQWEQTEFDILPYRETGTVVLKLSDELQQQLDDHIALTQTLSFSTFKKHFEADIMAWDSQLNLISEITEEWINCQREWMALEPIFSAPEMIKQLPGLHKKFKQVDTKYRKSMNSVQGNPTVLAFCSSQKVLKVFQDSNVLLSTIQKGLNNYLETKRKQFARLYFLADDELLVILAQAQEPRAVQPYLKKCFQNIEKLNFEDNNDMTCMYSKGQEQIEFVEPVNAHGSVEVWLEQVESMMKRSVRNSLWQAIEDYEETDRNDWVLKWPGQVIICGAQIFWTRRCEQMLNEKGFEGLKEYYEILKTELNSLTDIVSKDITKLERTKLSALITIDVHARDVIGEMVQKGVGAATDFKWVSQMRYYWEEENCKVRQVESSFDYGYEYLGNTGRLVITPLTDRIYLTLTGALHLNLGGAPAGPAGTGKTETVKDLGKALAKQVVVFNCQEGLDEFAMGKFFKGLVMAGAWACFDEFNRIDVEVLSVVAQQITTLQEAVRAGLHECEFENTTVTVDPTFAVYITMNPGYAGRTELPDNLKALFRPVACMIPDYALIAEIRLFSFGFLKAKPLSQKMVATFRLSSEQLSSQDHYDFGMRALNTVIAAAGLLKREDPSLDEEILLLRALRDSNLPKFLVNDVILFDGIISDLFPSTKIPDVDYGALIKQITASIDHFGLQPNEAFIKKVIQLYETTVLRHGLMIVGLTTGGKTSNYKVLQHALTKLSKVDKEKYKPVKTTIINPKSVTMAQLYGEYDRNTREWKDGVLANEFRAFVQDTSETRKWLIFDGPVDALWIESMNTVLDDNKKLCLVSGAIIEMTSSMNILFEVQDLAVASPATVSRCGMVYMEPIDTVPVSCLVKSWVQGSDAKIKPLDQYKEKIQKLFETFLEPCIEFIETSPNIFQYVKAVRNNLAQSCFNLYESLLTKYNVSRQSLMKQNEELVEKLLSQLPDVIEPLFLFSLIWSVGASCDGPSRRAFDGFLREIMAKEGLELNFPKKGLLYDYKFDEELCQWVHWLDTEPEFSLDPKAKFNSIIVPTTDTIRYNFILETLMSNSKHVLCIGPTGTGKSLTVSQKIMTGMDKQFMPLFVFFSARTDANSTQDIIDGKLEKHRKGTYGPPLGKNYIIFVDDLNMPQQEEYFAQPPIELLRQWMDHEGWYEYNTERLNFRKVVKTQFVAAMGPPGGGRNPVTDRFLRHFNFLSFPEMEDDVIEKIFSTILGGWIGNNLKESMMTLTKPIVQASISLYNTIRETMLPTPSKSHYTFNLRDLAKVFQGILEGSPRSLNNENAVVRLWIHECKRIFEDRLVDDEDRGTFEAIIESHTTTHFSKDVNEVIDKNIRLIYGDFMSGGADGDYEQINEMEELTRVVNEQLEYYNSGNDVQMNLVMFMDAIEHVSRISRIIRQPGGNALLLGVGGSGRQSLTRLATFMADYKLFQIEIKKNYEDKDWKDDLKVMLLDAGKNDKKSVFLFTDTQIVRESFLEDVNNLLNSGDIPNLMDTQDLEEIYGEMKKLCAIERLPQTPPSLYARFVKQVKYNLHIVLAMSPTTEIFRTRLRMFPSLVTCCTIDWFSAWPREGLTEVAVDKLNAVAMEENILDGVIETCVHIHETVFGISKTYLEEEGRHNHVTPTSYLELLQTFERLLGEEVKKIEGGKKKFEVGLSTLKKTEVEVKALEEELKEKQPILKRTQEEIKVNMKKIEVDKAAANETRIVVEKEEAEASSKEKECQQIADSAQADLDKALPLLSNAIKSLSKLKVENIKEVSGYKAPTAGVLLTMQAVCVMLNKKAARVMKDGGKVVLDWWEPAKKMLTQAKELRNNMINYDKDNIPDKKIKAISKFINDPNFTPAEVSRSSKACTAMCEWVRAMYNYYHVSLEVEPKKKLLKKSKGELVVVQERVQKAKQELKDVNDKIQKLEDENAKAVKKQQELADEVEACTMKLNNANRLIAGLAGEKTRWIETLANFEKQSGNLVGDMLVAAGSVAYLGPFTAPFRNRLIQSWYDKLSESNLLYTANTNVEKLVEQLAVRNWNTFGLPSDSLSIQNAIIMSKARRWPLMIDPQLQANKWIRNMEKENGLKVVTFNQKDYLRTLLNAVQFGSPVLLENIGEELDPAIEPILLKQTFMKNGSPHIRIGEDIIQFNNKFRLYITTKLRNPAYTPEAFVKVTLLNFFITPKGLEDQLLGTVVKMETPELEQMKNDLMKQNVKMNNDLVKIQDNILKMINESDEDILSNEALINALEESKLASEQIMEKVKEAEETEKEIDETRSKYNCVAYRGSILFFCISDMTNVDPMYQYSLQWFIKLFIMGIESAEEDDDLSKRLDNLINYFTYSLYNNVCQSLFAKHKLLFSFVLTTRILAGDDNINENELRFFLTGLTPGSDPEQVEKPKEQWITDKMWKELLYLNECDSYNGLIDSFKNNLDQWYNYFMDGQPHNQPVPFFNDKLDEFQRILILRAVRPDKVNDGVMQFVTKVMGKKFVTPPRFDLARSFKDSSNVTPLIMILSPGADPKTEMNKFAESMRIKRFASISLGRGTEKKAMQAVKDAINEGTWVLLQNCHLAISFMPQLEAIVEEFSNDNHRDFRLWLTSMPTPKFPVSVLQNSVKMTLEPPKGLQANLLGSFDALDDNSLDHESKPVEFKKLLFSLCFFHAIVQERRKFGPLGWNIPYEFTNGDLNICIQQLHLFLEKYDEVPFEVIQFLTGQINYGGRVTDDWDRRTLMNIIDNFLTPKILEDGCQFSARKEYFSLPVGEHKDYVHYIESFPLYTHPETFGLHENAEITYNISEMIDLTETIIAMSPGGGGAGANKDELIDKKAKDILDVVPKPFDITLVQERFPTKYEDSMNTVVVQEAIRYNKLLSVIHKSLNDLRKAIKGLVVMSEPLEKMYNSMFNNQVPTMWEAQAYPSLMPLSDWVLDLVARCQFIQKWIDHGHPKVFWVSGFYFPQGFLTGALQNYARRYQVAIDEVSWDFEVLDGKTEDDVEAGPQDGIYINGLYLEGARWDAERKVIAESQPKQLFDKMPIIWMKPIVNKPETAEGVYRSPVYKTLQRAGTLSTTGHSTNYIVCIELPSDKPESFWIGRGTALISSLRFYSDD